MKTNTVFVAILFLLLSACSTTQMSSTPPPATPAPTPTLFTDYTMGSIDIPPGQFLFVEFNQSSTCSSECNCPVVEPARSIYGFNEDGSLWIDPDALGGEEVLKVLQEAAIPGLYGYGQWQERIYAIDNIPFVSPLYGELQIFSIRADGSMVVDTQNRVMLLASGETWSNSSLAMLESPPGCTIRYDTQVTNHGYLTWEQIHSCPMRNGCQ